MNPDIFYPQAASVAIIWNGRVPERREGGEGSLQVMLKKRVNPASEAAVRSLFPVLCTYGDRDQAFDTK